MAREAPHSSMRAAARLAIGFALDLVKLGGFGRDVVDGLLLAAISQANITQINRNPELQLQYATLDQPPPDELRRPVSVSAIAHSLRLPFETTRRRIGALVELSVVRQAPRGVVIPTGPLNSPFYRMIAEANYALVRNLYFRLRAIGLFEDLPRPNSPVWDPEHPPMRLVIRMSTDFLLRLAEPLCLHIGDVVTGLVMMDLFQANTEHLPDTEAGRDDPDWSAEGFVPGPRGRARRAPGHPAGDHSPASPASAGRRSMRTKRGRIHRPRARPGPWTGHSVHAGQSVAPAPAFRRIGGFRRSLGVGARGFGAAGCGLTETGTRGAPKMGSHRVS
jgi:hypothetical protein